MSKLADVIGTHIPLKPSGERFVGACTLDFPSHELSVIGERWRCVRGCHEQNGADALGFLRCTGLTEAEAKAQLEVDQWVPIYLVPVNGVEIPTEMTETPIETPQDAGGCPPSEFPPEALETRPKPSKRRLRVVGGGEVVDLADPDAIPMPAELSESGIAARFTMLHRDKYRVVHEWSNRHGPCWMTWDGTIWKREPNRISAMQDARALGHGIKEWHAARAIAPASQLKWESKKFLGAMLDLAGYAPEFIMLPEQFDSDAYLLGCPTVTVDLRIGKAREPEREDYITRSCGVDPAPGACPWWDKVIERISRGDDSLRAYVQRWCGYLLTGGENVHEAFLFVYGHGASGKSKFISTLQDILGTGTLGYFRKADKEVFTHSGDHNINIGEKIARLQGARLVTVSELEEGSRWKESLLKDFTGRERVEGRALYEQTTEFSPSFKLIFSGNHKPALRSVGEEIKRRLHLLEFPGTIPEEERIVDLPDKLRGEYPQILEWMIQGALMVQEAGLGKPEQIVESTLEYLTDEDTLSEWFSSACEVDMQSSTLVGEAYKSYSEQAKSDGEHYIISKKRFSQRMSDKGYKSSRIGGGTRVFKGFRLKQSPAYADAGWAKD